MSHVVSIKCKIKDLAALKKACPELGLVFKENQTHYKWWGYSVGDYPLPQGYTENDLGKCEHAIGLKSNMGYEIGVCKSKTTAGEYELVFDFFNQQALMTAVGGQKCEKLVQTYQVEVAKKHLPTVGEGWEIQTRTLANGEIEVEAVKY